MQCISNKYINKMENMAPKSCFCFSNIFSELNFTKEFRDRFSYVCTHGWLSVNDFDRIYKEICLFWSDWTRCKWDLVHYLESFVYGKILTSSRTSLYVPGLYEDWMTKVPDTYIQSTHFPPVCEYFRQSL